ncbi:MAG: CDP-diacylglycerol--serine O-phosphatidyltransferase [Gammaproteobacteria bacterium]|nr:CDP-diacylglycerol--serine O-phosphatidyltransferase [Gammaproteobacteria bacterium]
MKPKVNLSKEKIRARGIYLLPNALTTAALFSGFYAIVAAMKGLYSVAAIAIFAAMIADGLDGRVARLTNTQTLFGAEYDSLSDMVAFAVAPSLAIYSWSLSHLGKVGWLVAFIYTAATALRLARFNTQLQDDDKGYFQGLPSPSAAAVIACMVWLGDSMAIPSEWAAIPTAIVTFIVAALMVSRVRYYSFKKLDFHGKVPFIVAVLLVLIIAAVAMDPARVLSIIFVGYVFSGPIITLSQKRKMRKRRERV